MLPGGRNDGCQEGDNETVNDSALKSFDLMVIKINLTIDKIHSQQYFFNDGQHILAKASLMSMWLKGYSCSPRYASATSPSSGLPG